MPAKTNTKAMTVADEFKGSIKKMEPQFAAILPKHVTPEKFSRVLQTAVALKPEIASADRRLLWGEIMKCAGDGLVPDGREATIYAYGQTPKYIPMVAGICKKARNSGLIQTIDAQVVYENDTYRSWIDERGQHFTHEKVRGNRGEILLTYAYAITKDEGFFYEEIDEEQMSAIEKSSKAKDGPWKGPFRDEMRRKSAIRRLAKYRLPSSSDLEDVIRRDDDMYDLEGKGNPAKPAPAKDTPSRLKSIIDTEEVPAAAPAPQADPKSEDPQSSPQEEPPI